MQARNMFLTVLIGGPLAGALMGLAADPKMVPSPEPTWRSARPDPVYSPPRRIVEHGPQDLSPTWYVDRMPTWKRRAAEREAAAYASLHYSDDPAEPLGEAPAPAHEPEPEPAFAARVVTWPAATPLAEAAAEQASDSDARSGAGAVAEAGPSFTDAAPDPAL